MKRIAGMGQLLQSRKQAPSVVKPEELFGCPPAVGLIAAAVRLCRGLRKKIVLHVFYRDLIRFFKVDLMLPPKNNGL
jgi:hypothetical protein